MEWARRQLEGFRSRTVDAEDQRRIDLACDRPERVNPRLVDTYVEALEGSDPEGLETFVTHALEDRDANACMAAFLLARQAPEGDQPRWVRMVLNGLGSFPDAALSTLRSVEAEARAADAEAARRRPITRSRWPSRRRSSPASSRRPRPSSRNRRASSRSRSPGPARRSAWRSTAAASRPTSSRPWRRPGPRPTDPDRIAGPEAGPGLDGEAGPAPIFHLSCARPPCGMAG